MNGRVALVTGGGQGVGEEIARTLGLAGADVLVNDLVLERADRVAYVSPEAQRLLAAYFRGSGGRLPQEVAEWLRERRKTSSAEPLTVERDGQSVAVHLVDGSLLLEERTGASLLTSRESEIVDLLAAGKTNAEIAELLWIAPGTVRKHLENVYEKLGVHSRTAAVAMVRSDRTFAAG